MKKRAILPISCIIALISCTGAPDFDVVNPNEQATNTESIKENVQKVFGVTFDPNHDWCSTTSGCVTITGNNSIKKVQVIAYVQEMGLEGELVTSMRIMNEADYNGGSVQLNYDAPKDALGIFVAFISDSEYTLKKVENDKADYSKAVTRALPEGLTLPTVELTLGEPVESYASQRGWISGEKLYALTDYTAQKMTPQQYSEELTQAFRAMVFSYFKNGRDYNNLPLVKSSGYYNDKAYPITTGEDPIIISPVYKCDGSLKTNTGYGYEIFNSDLYYYYSDVNDPAYQANPVEFLQNLPKYKALQFKDLYIEREDDVLEKRGSYALIYWGEGIPTSDTKGSYTFPAGLKIGFMVRANTDFKENGKPRKQGELYGDGRLNNQINNYDACNFKSSKLGTDGPRVAWLTFNGKKLMCWESGTDSDFNDILIEVEGGLDIPNIPIEPEYQAYTYCFEDRELGDYDMNDIVIKAVRKDETHVEYSIVACGAYDELYVRNINCGKIKDNAEVHGLFKKELNEFINTVKGGEYCEPITATKTVSKTFSFLNPDNYPFIYDKTTDKTIRLSKIGEDPHGIMIPNDFKYPVEKTCIKNVYAKFNEWGQDAITSTDWYAYPIEGKYYTAPASAE